MRLLPLLEQVCQATSGPKCEYGSAEESHCPTAAPAQQRQRRLHPLQGQSLQHPSVEVQAWLLSRWQLQPLSLLAARTEAAAVQCLRSSPENNRSSLPLLFWHCLASDCSKQCRAAHVRLTWKVHHASESPTCLARHQMAAEGLKSRQWKHMKTAGDWKTWKSAKSYVSPGFLR